MTFTQNGKMIRDLNLYENFIAVIEQPSITAAAETLGRSVQAVSRDLGRLEAEFGVSLIARSTRRRKPTPAGLALYERLKPLLAELARIREETMSEATVVSGALKVAAPMLFGPRVLTPLVADFLARYPQVSVHLTLEDSFIDPTVSGADVSVRIGETPNSALIARRLGAVRRVIVAAPSYLSGRDQPLCPSDLRSHQCVVRHGPNESARWTFRVGGREESVLVRGRFETDSVGAAIEAVVQGLGIGIYTYWQVRDLIDQGRLQLLLTDCEPNPLPVQALWVATPHLPARTRLFIEFLATHLAGKLK
jgi:DNA-binding transcriptional LysR family regulator